jgi:signal transduction histidine kinase/ligand-binding sensor domain-containing protein
MRLEGGTQRRISTALGVAIGVALAARALALDPALQVSQYAHTAWTVRDRVFKGNIYAMAQTPDGYLWLGGEFGLYRFDGVRTVPWFPPAGQRLPDQNINSLLATRDGTLWIGTFGGLATLSGGMLTPHKEVPDFVASLFEDRTGTVWVGTLDSPHGRLCAIRNGTLQCYGEDGGFGRAVWGLHQDSSGTLWAAAESGLWRIEPGPLVRYPSLSELSALTRTDDGRPLAGQRGAGLRQLVGDRLEPFPIRSAVHPERLLPDDDVDSNKLLVDRDGGLWIGTVQRGLVHVHRGRADVFTLADGLSGDVVLSLFEDREGTIWVATTGGLDRFRDLPVTTLSTRHGLSSDATQSVLAATDGSVWIGAVDGLTRIKDGRTTIFRKGRGLPDAPESLYQDHRERIWVSTRRGLTYFTEGRFVLLDGVPGGEVHCIAGDASGNLWLSEHHSFLHVRDGRLVAKRPWSELGRRESAQVLLPGREPGSLWVAFWIGGGVSYLEGGRLRASYTSTEGMGEGPVVDLRLDSGGVVWAATGAGGLSRLQDGRITTLTSRNGLPCDAIHWTMEDHDRSLWLYTACGLVRVTRSELQAWIADPARRVETKVWDAAEGIRLRSSATSAYGPRVAKARDGKLWFVTGEGVQVVNPAHLPVNTLPPPVHIEQVTADRTPYDPTSAADGRLRLPPLTRDLEIDYTALSLVAPEKVLFRYKLEGRDGDWQEAGTRRRAFYNDLPPGGYRFRVTACNNSGVWNETGAALEFEVAPAYHQTIWFRALTGALLTALLWAAYRARLRIVERHTAEIGALNERLMKAQEQERTRIAGELHDSVMQQITALSLVLGTAKRKIAADSEAREMVADAQRKLIDVGTEVRQISHDLHPPELKQMGLPAVVRSYCDSFSEAHGIPVSCEVEASVAELSEGTGIALYRIAQEALGNAAKHAAPTRVEVRLARVGRDVVLTIADDGRGRDAGQVDSGGLGLVNMRERARQLNGTFEFVSQPGRGTTVRVAVPFRPREAPRATGD